MASEKAESVRQTSEAPYSCQGVTDGGTDIVKIFF